jgi:hypothetical protein
MSNEVKVNDDVVDDEEKEKAKVCPTCHNEEPKKKKDFLYMVTIQPYYDPRTQQYVHIMTLNAAPPPGDPLSMIVKTVATPRMSTFVQEYEPFVYAVFDPENPSELITMSKISSFFVYILDNGYTINKMLSNVMTSPAMRNRAEGPKKDILCFIEK